MSEMHSSGSVNRARRNNIPSGEEIRFALRDKRDVAHEKLTRFPGPDLEHDEIRSNGDREGTALPLAGPDERSSLLEGWGGGAAAIHAGRVERVSPTRIASSDAMRLPPQAGEVQQVRGQADSTKNHPALDDLILRPQRGLKRRDVDTARIDIASHRQRGGGAGRLARHHAGCLGPHAALGIVI